MFETSSEAPSTLPIETKEAQTSQNRWLILVDLVVLGVLGVVLFWGTSTQFSNPYNDMTRYQCYAIAFWQGQPGLQAHGLQATPQSQCSFLSANSTANLIGMVSGHRFLSVLTPLVAAQSTTQAFHSLPPEYPFLTFIPFSIPLLAPFNSYQVTFALFMTLIVILIYVVLVTYQSRSAAVAFAFYLGLGSWATATDRFDLVPAALTLGALLFAGKSRWKWAFALLALATLYKFYPVLLAIPFLIAQQAGYKDEKWTKWRRWSGLGVFIGLGVLVTAISLACNIVNTYIPFTYFFGRPIEIESLPATLVWIGDHLLGRSVQYAFTYQSLNFVGSLTKYVSPLALLMELAGLLYTFWLQWRGKLNIYEVGLLTLLIIIITGKVFSPQYLIWVTPLVALVGRANWKWLLSWGLVGALTTFMFPLHFNDVQQTDQFYLAYVVRDFFILAMTCSLLYWYSKRKPEAVPSLVPSKQA
jgi:Glycosyltransferase family 87